MRGLIIRLRKEIFGVYSIQEFNIRNKEIKMCNKCVKMYKGKFYAFIYLYLSRIYRIFFLLRATNFIADRKMINDRNIKRHPVYFP